MRIIEKMIWSALCSAMIGLGAGGCVRSCGQPGDLDTPRTGGEEAVGQESELDDVYGPPAYGPPPSRIKKKPVVVEEESGLDDVYGPPAPVE